MTALPPFICSTGFLLKQGRHWAFAVVFIMVGMSAARGDFAPAVTMDGAKLHKSLEDTASGISIIEYIPEGETKEKWTKKAAFETYPGLNDPLKFAQVMAHLVKEKRDNSKVAMVKLPDGGVVIDFISWPPGAEFVEFNIFRISKNADTGLIVQKYALRAYGESVKPFLAGLKNDRNRLAESMATSGIQLLDK